MDLALLLTLAGLALVDSTSFGTLLIPLWLMTSPHGLRPGRILVFLGMVAAFYLLVGLVLLRGGSALADGIGEGLADSPVVLWVQLALGVALFAASFRVGTGGSGRVLRWRDRAAGGGASLSGVVGLALLAATLEVATMLPYLGALGLLAGGDLGLPAQTAVLAAYCLVMVLPALGLLGVRVALRSPVEPLLDRLSAWLERVGGEATAWVLGIVGFLVARDAVGRLLF
ncbi:GAP family protein [Nocardioides hungaricus]